MSSSRKKLGITFNSRKRSRTVLSQGIASQSSVEEMSSIEPSQSQSLSQPKEIDTMPGSSLIGNKRTRADALTAADTTDDKTESVQPLSPLFLSDTDSECDDAEPLSPLFLFTGNDDEFEIELDFDDHDEKKEVVKPAKKKQRKLARPVTQELGPSINEVKATFMAAINEFFAHQSVKELNQEKVAALLAYSFGKCCHQGLSLAFREPSPELPKKSNVEEKITPEEQAKIKKRKDKEVETYIRFSHILTLESYVAAVYIQHESHKDEQEKFYNKYLRENMIIFSYKLNIPDENLELKNSWRAIRQIIKNDPAITFQKFENDRNLKKYLPTLDKLDEFILDKITAPFPNEATELEFMQGFFTDILNKVEVSYHTRAPKFIVCLLHELANQLAARNSKSTNMKPLAEIFYQHAAVLTRKFLAANNGDNKFLPRLDNASAVSVSTNSIFSSSASSSSSSSSSSSGYNLRQSRN